MDEAERGSGNWRFLNDWPLRRFLLIGASFVIFLTMFVLARAWMDNGLLLDLLGYILVFFIILIPGACLLRIFRIHDLGYWKSLILSIVLGIAALFVLGFGLNGLHYLSVIEKPLTFGPINVGYIITTLMLLALVHHRDRDYQAVVANHEIEISTLLTWALAAFLPILATIGAMVAGYDGDRQILQYLLLALCLTPFAFLSAKVKRYELLILSIGLALLFHRSLLTNYLMGYDVFSEFTGATYTIAKGYWNYAESSAVLVGAGANTSMAIVIFIPILFNMTEIDVIMIFKLVYPLLYAFVPVAIYLIVKDQFGIHAGIVAAFVFMGMVEFYGLMIQLAKQEMAEIFLVALLLVMFGTDLSRSKKRTLSLIFLLGVMVSHYAIAFLTLGVFGLMIIFSMFFSLADGWRANLDKPWYMRTVTFLGSGLKLFSLEQLRKKVVSLDLLVISGAFFLVWYTYAASGVMLSFFVRGGNAVSQAGSATLLPGQFNLQSLDMLEYILIDQGSLLHNTPKLLFIVVQLLCIMGVIYSIMNVNGIRKSAHRDFLALGLVGGVLIVMGYTVPYFSSMFYYGRLFHYSLIFLSGFLLIGITGLISYIREIINFRKKGMAGISDRLSKASFVAAIVLVSAILFTNTSAAFSLAGDYNTSFAVDDSVSWSIYSDSDVIAAKWAALPEHRGNEAITADWHRFPIFGGLHIPNKNLVYSFNENDTDTLLFISSWNTQYNYIYPLNVRDTASLTYTDIDSITHQVNDTYGIPYSAGLTSYYYIPPVDPVTNPLGPSIYQYDDLGLNVLYGLIAILGASFVLSIGIVTYKRKRGS